MEYFAQTQRNAWKCHGHGQKNFTVWCQRWRRKNTPLEPSLKTFSGPIFYDARPKFCMNCGSPCFLWKNVILAYFAILCWKIFRNSKFFFSIKSAFSSLQHTLRRLSKVENCVLVARKAKTPKNGANFVKKIFLPETQLQVISKQNPYTPDPLGGRWSWWTPPHISTPWTQFSYLVSFLPTCVLSKV